MTLNNRVKIIFLDVDGTLCDQSGQVPNSAKKAIRSAKEKGLLVYVCTGRSKPEITKDILALDLDGIIGAGGGYIEISGEVISHKKMEESAVITIIDFFKQNDIAYYLESNDGLFGSTNCIETIKRQVSMQFEGNEDNVILAIAEFDWFYEILQKVPDKKIDYGNVNKISFISNGYPYEKVYKKFYEQFAMYHTTVPQFGPESGEIAVKGIDKKIAVETVLNCLNLTPNQAIAYGDGNNDSPMFSAVGWKVAMNDATVELKSVADEITDSAENDGIYNSFVNNDLINPIYS